MGEVIGRRDSGVGIDCGHASSCVLVATVRQLPAPRRTYGYTMQLQLLYDSGARPERALGPQQAVRRAGTGHVTNGP
jgi:hypothetical protein